MTRGIVKSPGVNLLLASDPARRVRTLAPGSEVEIVAGVQWLRVEVDGIAGLVPAASIESSEEHESLGSGAEAPAARGVGVQPFVGGLRFVGERLLAHVDFHPALQRLVDYAELADVTIHVIDSYRRPDDRVRGANVPVALRSNHLVGHAIDVELVLGDERLGRERLRREHFRDLPMNARYWLQQIRDDRELRWGGDFVHQDPVHIDDDLYGRDPEQWARKLAEA